MKAREKLQRVAQSVREFPRWVVLRLATVTGVSAGWWVMAICAAVVGAVAAVVLVTVVHRILDDRSALPVSSIESGSSDEIVVRSSR